MFDWVTRSDIEAWVIEAEELQKAGRVTDHWKAYSASRNTDLGNHTRNGRTRSNLLEH